MTRKHWTSRLSFILSAAAFAIGLGNIWRFPYLVGENGGGAFLLVYLALVFLVGIPILLTEVSLGRMAQDSPLSGFGRLSGRPVWNAVGWIELVAALLIMGFYVMILGWVGIYGWECLTGNLPAAGLDAFNRHFVVITQSSGPVFGWAVLLTVAGGLVVSAGLQKGIERLSGWMMPLLLVLILVLSGWALTLDGAVEGVRWYLHTDFSRITAETVLAALGQLFFSIGVGFTTAFVFGSYSRDDEDIVASTGTVVLADTFVAFLAGFMIFPALFAFGIAPDAGPSLVFVTMGQLFTEMPLGQLFGALFFLLLIVAGFTSLAGAVESVSESLNSRFGWSRRTSIGVTVGSIVALSVPNILSYGGGFFSGMAGRTFFEWTDLLANAVLIPLAGLLIILFAAYVVGFRPFQEATNAGAAFFRVSSGWEWLAKVVIPLALLLILLNGFL